MRYELFTSDDKTARKKIARHWQKLGFRKIRGNDYHAVSFGLQRPSTRGLLEE